MSNPILDEINAVTLAELKKDIVFDNFFKDNLLSVRLRKSEIKSRLGKTPWKLTAYDRMVAMGISPGRAYKVVCEMEKEKRKEASKSMRDFLDKRYKKLHGR